MKPGNYRREYDAYRTTCERARYSLLSGAAPSPDFALLAERYADLWTREVVAALERTHAETPAHLETERAGLRTLARAARLGYARARANGAVAELAHCEKAEQVEWGGAQRELRQIPDQIASEVDAVRRRELAAHWLDGVRACGDLRAARFEALNEAALSLGCDNYFSLLSEPQGLNTKKLLASAEVLLRRTEGVYNARLTQWASHFLPPTAARDLTYAESLFFRRLPHLEKFFPARGIAATYRDALAGFGIRVERQTNVRFEEMDDQVGSSSAACCPIKPPEDVRLLYRARGGARLYRDLFYEAGRAQHFAWASRELVARYPELVRPPSSATGEAYAFLFRFLLHEAAWLGERRGVKTTDAQNIARSFTLIELYEARRNCAILRYEDELARSADPRSERLAETYKTALTEATGFRHPADLRWLDIDEPSGSSADEFRSRLFAAALREYLRTRYGHRWWDSRKAGDELIDMWNTASRHTPEELASLTGIGPLDVELLTGALIDVLQED